MTDDATPKKIKRRRPTRYPASIAIMTTATQRAAIDGIADEEGKPIAEVVRELIDHGLLCYRDDHPSDDSGH
jgi:hypothetical protein